MANPMRWLRELFSRRSSRRRTPRWARPANWHRYLLQLERLENRIAPATNITIITGAAGAGTLDQFLSATQGTITVADDPGDSAATLSVGALQGVGAGTNISIAADAAIHFNDVGTLALQTATGHSALFTTTTGKIDFANVANTVTTAGASLTFSAGTDLTVSNLNTNGGDVSLTAGTSGTGNLQFGNILTNGSGNLTFQAGSTGGAITQATGSAVGQAITATAVGNISVNALRGTSVALTSFSGSVSSAGASPVQASAQLTLSAATGINLFMLTPSIRATNTTSGNIGITQLPPPNQDVTVVGSGVVNQAAGGTISLTNSAGNLAIATGSTVATNNGTIFLSGTGLDLAGGTVNSGNHATELHNGLAGLAFDIGSKVIGKIGLTQADLNAVTASVLRIGTNLAGSINVSAAIKNPATWNILALIANGPITEAAAGALTVPNLRVSGPGPVTLTSANNVGTLAADTAGAFSFGNGTHLLTVGLVDGDTGIVTSGSDIHLIADDMNLAQQVTTGSAAGIVNLEPFTTTETIDLGTNSAAHLGLTNAELNQVTAGVLRIGSASFSGNITVSAAISPANIGALSLITTSPGTITQGTGAPITVAGGSGGLAVQAATSVALQEQNDVGKLAAAITGAGNGLNFLNSAGFIVSTVDRVAGITTATGTTETVVLTAGGSVTQDAGANVTSTNLRLQGAGGYALTNSGNDVATLAASVTNGVSYTDANNLAISGSTPGIDEVQTVTIPTNVGSGTFTLTFTGPDATSAVVSDKTSPLNVSSPTLASDIQNALDSFSNIGGVGGFVVVSQSSTNPLLFSVTFGGTLAGANVQQMTATGTGVANPVVATQRDGEAGAAGVTTNGVDINITASAVAGGTALTVSQPIDTTSTANITLSADRMSLGAVLSTHAGILTLEPTTAGRAVDLGTNTDTTHLGLLQADLNNVGVFGGVLRIGNLNSSGNITVTAPIQDGGLSWNTLSLLTEEGAGISQNSGATLTVANLNAAGNTGVALNANNVVSFLAGATEFGAFSFIDHTNLTVDNVDSGLGNGFGSGIITQGQAVSLTVNVLNDSLTVNQRIDTTHDFGTPVPGGANINLSADRMALNNNVPASHSNAGTGGVLSLTPFTPSNVIAVGGPDAAGQLGIDDNDLANVTAKAVRIGSTAQTGQVTVDGTINTHAGYGTLDLIATGTGGAVTQTTGSIAVGNLALQASAGIGSAGAIQVVGPINLAFHNSTSNNVKVTGTGALTIAAVDTLDGTAGHEVANLAAGGIVTLQASSPMTFTVNTSSSGTYTAITTETSTEGAPASNPLPPPDDDITVNSNVTIASTGGDVDLTSGDSIVTQSGSVLKSASGAVNLKAGMGDVDNDAKLELGGSISAANVSMTSPGDICVGGINVSGTATITSTNGAILDCADTGETEPANPTDDFSNGASVDVTAGTLHLSASTGIGITNADGVGPLETQVDNLEANTSTGGIFITNGVTAPVTLNIVGNGFGPPDGVVVTGSGDLQLINQGSIHVLSQDNVIRSPGNITVEAFGPGANVQTGGQFGLNAIRSTGSGAVLVTAGQDITMGNAGGFGSIASADGSVTVSAGGNLTIDSGSRLAVDNVGGAASGNVAATVGGNITLQQTNGAGAHVENDGSGAISLTTGAGGVFTLNSGAGGSVTSAGGSITISADDMIINDAIDASKSGGATPGAVTLQQGSATTRNITLGGGASGLGLSDAELGRITASDLVIGRLDNAGNISLDGNVIAHPGYSTLSLLSGGSITQPGGSLAVTSLSADGAGGVTLTNAANAVTNLSGSTDALSSFFSTGNPDGRMATASRPDVPGAPEIESADDFVLSAATQVGGATFTGLLPGGTPLSSVSRVVVEVYRVFPNDSNVARTSGAPTFSTSQVPTRVNSPSDNAFDARDSAAGNLAFTAAQLAASFTANSSVLNGIRPTPNQTTGGEGAVTGEEVQFSVLFGTPFNLPAGHYFFVPQVQLTGGNFLWLSAPKPIVAPGTPFVPDLQEWIRNAALDPDWLRVGTDVVGGAPAPTFNAAFALSGLTPTSNAFNFADSAALTVGTVEGVSGITANGSVTLQSSVGNTKLTVNQPVTTNGAAGITFTFDNMSLGAAVSAAGNRVTLKPFSAGQLIDVGTNAGLAGTLGLAQGDLGNVTAGVLQVGNSTGGNITVSNAINLTTATTLDLETGGAIVEGAPGSLGVANLALRAVTGIGGTSPLATAVGNLAFQNRTSGAVQISNTGAVTVTGIDNLLTSFNQGTTTTLTAASPMTFAVSTTSAGTLTATAAEAATGSDDLTVNANVTLESTGGDVVLQAGDNLDLQTGSVIKSDAGTVTLDIGFNDNDGDGSNLSTIAGTVSGTGPMVTGGSGPNNLLIDFTNGASLPDGLTDDGGASSKDTLTVSDAGGGATHAYTLSDTSVVRDGTTIAINNLAGVTAAGGNLSDSFAVTPSPTVTFKVSGGLPNPPASPGDTLQLNLAGTTGAALADTFGATGFSGTWTFTNRQPIAFDTIETLRPTAHLAVSITAGALVDEGALTYNVTVANNGPDDATNVTLTDVLPAGVVFQSATFGAITGSASGGTVTVHLGTITSGNTISGTIVVQVPEEGTVAGNPVSVSSDLANPFPADASAASAAVTVPDVPVLVHSGGEILMAGVDYGTLIPGSFIDPAGAEDMSHYQASVNWGDGASGPGTLQFDPSSGTFTVLADHVYAHEGNYTITLTVHHENAADVVVTSPAFIADAPLFITSLTPPAAVGVPFAGPVATFADYDVGAQAGDFTASVFWGDGTISTGAVQALGMDRFGHPAFRVTASHFYGSPASGAFSVIIHDDKGGKSGSQTYADTNGNAVLLVFLHDPKTNSDQPYYIFYQ